MRLDSKSILGSLLFLCIAFVANAQKTTLFSSDRVAVVRVSDIREDLNPRLQNLEMPSPSLKKQLDYEMEYDISRKGLKILHNLDSISVMNSFIANAFNMSTPCDNDIAVSNNGKLVSVMNTTLYFFDTEADSALGTVSLSAFFAPLGLSNQEFDPKVLYDPEMNKFIVVALNGYVDSTSAVLVAFSQSDEPTGNWNLYTLPGDPTISHYWSDYPIISVNGDELFITLNLLANDSTWQAGFKETIIWQISKDEGYNGQPLLANLINNISFQGSSLMNLCPIKSGTELSSNTQYFLSNRNFSTQNDSIFIISVVDTIGSPLYSVNVELGLQERFYGFPPDADQNNGMLLATNDARILGGFIQNDRIQYVHNTRDDVTGNCGVFYGIIKNISSGNFELTGEIIGDSVIDFGYPNISYAGIDTNDNSAIISFDHVSQFHMPGMSALKTDGEGNFSPIRIIRNGTSFVNLLAGNTDRWGDYTGSQRKYNEPGIVWVSGYLGKKSSLYYAHSAIVAKLNFDFLPTSIILNNNISEPLAFPNPASGYFVTEFWLNETDYLQFSLLDVNGRCIKTVLRELCKPGKNAFSFSLESIEAGVYFLSITGKKSNPRLIKFVKT